MRIDCGPYPRSMGQLGSIMGACLSDNDLSALAEGSADAGQTDEWNRHID